MQGSRKNRQSEGLAGVLMEIYGEGHASALEHVERLCEVLMTQ